MSLPSVVLPPGESLPEFTAKAVVTGIVLGLVFGAANAYLGLRVGLTVSASIPAAVLTVAVFRLLGRKGSILEANISQTIGSASTALATGTIFTIPALFLWGAAPPYLQVVALCFLGALLGLSAMIPLRRILIVDAHAELPYPEGTACAEVLRATAADSSGSVWIFRGIAVGALVKIIVSLLFVNAFRGRHRVAFPAEGGGRRRARSRAPRRGLHRGVPRLWGVLVAGSIVSSLVLIPLIAFIGQGLAAPLAPEAVKLVSAMSAGEIWSRYVRYVGAGAVATAGILTVLKNFPTMAGAFLAVVRGVRGGRGGERRSRRSRRAHGPGRAGRLRLRRHRADRPLGRARARDLLGPHGPAPRGPFARPAWASSASSSSRSRRASSASWAFPRSRRRASRS